MIRAAHLFVAAVLSFTASALFVSEQFLYGSVCGLVAAANAAAFFFRGYRR